MIQRKEITNDDVKTAFTVQQILVITTVCIAFYLTSFIKKFYNLPQDGIFLYWAILLSFFISSLKTIPSVFLERKIQFQKIVFVQVVENTLFYIAISIFALLNFDLKSFTFATLIRSFVGLFLIYSISFWLPQIGISFKSLKKLLSFGVPFQMSSFLALFKDDLITLFLAKVVGFGNLAYIGWAKKWAEAPIRIIMDNISRVLFPVISRLQHDKKRVAILVEKILYYQTLLLAPTIIGIALIMPILILIIPKYNYWVPALPLFYLFCFSSFFSSYSTPFMNLFNALGKVRISLSFMFFWTVITWIFTPTFTKLFGLYGFPITQVLLSLTFIAVVYVAKKEISFNFFKPIYRAIISSILMGIMVFFTLTFGYSLNLIFKAILGIIIGGLSYLIILRLVFNINLIFEIKSIFFNE